MNNRVATMASAVIMAASTACLFPAFAQTAKLKGSYVLVEEGLTAGGGSVTSLASLQLDTGVATGALYVQTSSGLLKFDVQGAYSLDADNTGTLNYSATATDSEGETVNINAGFAIVLSPSGDACGVRTNPGYYTTARLTSASQLPVQGVYMFTENSRGRPAARVVQLNIDAAGNADGFQIADVLGTTSRSPIGGAVTSESSGFKTLTLLIHTTDENGDRVVSSKEKYLLIPTRNDLRMIRADGQPSEAYVVSR